MSEPTHISESIREAFAAIPKPTVLYPSSPEFHRVLAASAARAVYEQAQIEPPVIIKPKLETKFYVAPPKRKRGPTKRFPVWTDRGERFDCAGDAALAVAGKRCRSTNIVRVLNSDGISYGRKWYADQTNSPTTK